MKLLQDNQGNFSSNRVVKLVGLIWAGWLTTVIMLKADDPIVMAAAGGFFVSVLGALAALTAYAKKKETESEKISADFETQSLRPSTGPIKP